MSNGAPRDTAESMWPADGTYPVTFTDEAGNTRTENVDIKDGSFVVRIPAVDKQSHEDGWRRLVAKFTPCEYTRFRGYAYKGVVGKV